MFHYVHFNLNLPYVDSAVFLQIYSGTTAIVTNIRESENLPHFWHSQQDHQNFKAAKFQSKKKSVRIKE